MVGGPSGTYARFWRRIYDTWGRWYDPFIACLFWFIGGQAQFRQAMLHLTDLAPAHRVLDLCCGTGTLTLLVASRMAPAGLVIGLDGSRTQLHVARGKDPEGRVAWLLADAEAVPLASEAFDRMLISAALHEMPHEARQNVLAEARRLLKPEGRLIVGDHHRPPRRWVAWLWEAFERLTPEHATHRDLLERGLETEMCQAGFLVLDRLLTNAGILQVVVCQRARSREASRCRRPTDENRVLDSCRPSARPSASATQSDAGLL